MAKLIIESNVKRSLKNLRSLKYCFLISSHFPILLDSLSYSNKGLHL